MNEQILKTRIRNKKNQPRGVLMAKKMDDVTVCIGWSLCKPCDAFDMENGLMIASARAGNTNLSKMPRSIKNDFIHFAKRCEKYFKGQTVIGSKMFS